MRNIINFLITLLIFWLGSHYFSDYIFIQDTQTLIIATVLMFVMSVAFGLLMLLSLFLIPLGIGIVTTILLVILAFVLAPIELYVLSSYLPGFHINGFWTYVILTITIGFFSIKVKSKNNGTTENSN